MRCGSFVLIVAAALGGLVGCIPPASPQSLRDYITIRSPGNSVQMRVSADRIYGPDADVSRVPEGYRGQVRNNLLDLRLDNTTIRGTRGGAVVDLKLSSSGQTLIVQGLYAGKLSWLEVGPTALVGTFGDCTYDTRAATQEGASYKGVVSCGRFHGPVTIILPELTRTMRLDETAAMLSIALAR